MRPPCSATSTRCAGLSMARCQITPRRGRVASRPSRYSSGSCPRYATFHVSTWTSTIASTSACVARRTTTRSADVASADRLREVGDEVADRLDADREAHEARGRRELGAADRAMSHCKRDLDERLDATE